MYFLITLSALVAAAVETPRLVKGKNWRELAAFSLLMLVSLVYSIGLALNLNLPNPNQVFRRVFAPLVQYLQRLLG